MSVRFHNRSSIGDVLDVYWIDLANRRVGPYRTLAAGESYVQQTSSGHEWVAVSRTTGRETARVVVSGALLPPGQVVADIPLGVVDQPVGQAPPFPGDAPIGMIPPFPGGVGPGAVGPGAVGPGAVGPNPLLPGAVPPVGGPVCDHGGCRPARIRFLNRAHERVNLYRVDSHGHTVFSGSLSPGYSSVQDTTVGERWVAVADCGTVLRRVTASPGYGLVRITEARGPVVLRRPRVSFPRRRAGGFLTVGGRRGSISLRF